MFRSVRLLVRRHRLSHFLHRFRPLQSELPEQTVCLPKGDKITNMYISFPLRKYHFHMSKYQFQSKFVEVEEKIVKVEYKFVEVELKFVEVEVEIRGRSRQTNRRSRMLKHYFVQYDNFL